MSVSAAAEESRYHLTTTWAELVRDRGGVITRADGVSRMWADSPFGFWNTLTLTGVDTSAERLKEQLAAAASFMRGAEQAGYLWVFEDLLGEQAREQLLGMADASGLTLAFSGRAMAGNLSITEPRHPELEFRRVRSDEDLAIYGELNARAYGMAPEVGRAALAGSPLWRTAYAFIGFRDGVAVTCAATIAAPDAVFLALVATDPGEMRKGYGEAVTRKAIHEGLRQTGHRRVVLHATEAGQPVYERIGCETDTAIHFFQLAAD